MATTFVDYTGDGNATKSFSFPSYKVEDIKVDVDGVIKTVTTHYNITSYTTTGGGNVVFTSGNIPASPASIRIYRDTDVDTAKATYTAGSSVKAGDLNNNMTQILYAAQEEQNQTIISSDIKDGAIKTVDIGADQITNALIADDQIDSEHYVDGSIDTAHIADSQITSAKIADGTIVAGDLASNAITTVKITDSNITTAKIADSNITTAKIADSNVTTAKIAADAVNGTKIADDSINSEHYVDGSIDTVHIADNQITTAKIADNQITTAKIVDANVTTAKIADNAVTMAKLNSGTLPTDITVASANLVDGTIATADIANNAVTTVKITDSNVTTAKIADSNVTTAKIAADAVNGTKIADDAINSEHYADLSINTAHLNTSSVTTAKIDDNAVTTVKITDANVTSAKIAASNVTTAKIADNNVTTAKIADSNVTSAKIAANAVTSAKIADDAVGSTELGDGVIDTVHVGAAQITTAKLADSNVTTAKITDANVTTAKIADNAITIGKIGCEQTTLSNSDSHIPTSGAVVDYVAAQIAPLGGLEVIATEVAFPNTQPSSGVVISISDAGGVVVNGSGVSTTGRTVGGSTVTINGFPASLQSKTMAADIGLMVSSTGSSQTYTYHKILAKEADVEQLSNDINDFAARYRVGSTNPTSDLDAGDLFFNTGTSKLLVYNATNSAWEEAQSIGNFFISTFSEAFDGSRTQFTLSNAPTNVQQVILSLNGVVQKPGTAFTLSGSTVTLASAPASGTDYFAVVMGSTVNIGTPSNNTVTTAILQDDSVTSAKIAASNVTATELGANAVITSKIADDAVTNAKIGAGAVGSTEIATNAIVSDKINTGQVTTAKLGDLAVSTAKLGNDAVTSAKIADGAIVNADINASAAIARTKLANVDLVDDTSPQLGGNLDTNDKNIVFGDSSGATVNRLTFGAGNDLTIFHDGNNSFIKDAGTGRLSIVTSQLQLTNAADSEVMIKATENGAVELYYDNSKKFETTANGTNFTGTIHTLSGDFYPSNDNSERLGLSNRRWEQVNGYEFNVNEFAKFYDNIKAKFGDGDDLQIYHDGSNSYIQDSGTGDLIVKTNIFRLRGTNDEAIITGAENGNVALYYDNSKKFETTSGGASVTGTLSCSSNFTASGGSNVLGNTTINGGGGAGGVALTVDYSGTDVFKVSNLGKVTITGDLDMQNDDRILFGTDDRLRIWYDGSNGYIRNYTSGSLNIGTENGNHLVFRANAGDRWRVNTSGHFEPMASGQYDIGTSSARVRNFYTNDLHLSNEGSSNDVDGTWGDYTIQEGESDLFLKNNRSGKKYKFNLTEVS